MAKQKSLSRKASAVPAVAPARHARARYESAQTTTDNRRLWNGADGFSPDAQANPEARRVIRNRSRYEYANNSYCQGIIHTLANDCVGVGPRLQMLTEDENLNAECEQDFTEWAAEVGLAEILWAIRAGRAHSGEGIGVICNNPGLASIVKLDVRLVEPEQLTMPYVPAFTVDMVDGIEFDEYGNPTFYNVLKNHPGGTAQYAAFFPMEFDRIAARYVLHFFRADRPGQRRGVPDITPAVPLFAELRRYCAAVIAAAETAADFAMTLESAASDVNGEGGANVSDVEVTPFDVVELNRRMGTVLPRGTKLNQTKAEQPTTTHDGFVKTKLAEIARCVSMPLTVAAMSTDANMSSSYVVSQPYTNSVRIDRGRLEKLVLARLIDEWLTEWVRVKRLPNIPDRFPHQWFWPSLGHHADPAKVAAAQTARLGAGTTTIPREFAKDGLDWEDEQASAAKSLGISVKEYQALLRQKLFGSPMQQQQQNPSQPEDTTDESSQTESQ